MRVPTSTGPTSASTTEAKKQARALTLLLESLEDIKRTRKRLVDRVTQLADADDIGPRIMKVATGFERWMDVQPEMFVDVSDEELAKYDKFLQDMKNTREEQERTLNDIKVRYGYHFIILPTVDLMPGTRYATKRSCSLERRTRQSESENKHYWSLMVRTTCTRRSHVTLKKG